MCPVGFVTHREGRRERGQERGQGKEGKIQSQGGREGQAEKALSGKVMKKVNIASVKLAVARMKRKEMNKDIKESG